MAPVTIDVDGHIDLIAEDGASSTDGPLHESARSRRLNDVMIVLERQQADLEYAIQHSVRDGVIGEQFAGLSLTLDEQAPKFRVEVELAETAETPLGPEQRAALEADIATLIFNAIEARAVKGNGNENRRWRPSVSVKCRAPKHQDRRLSQRDSIWLKALLVLLVLVILGAGYLFLGSL